MALTYADVGAHIFGEREFDSAEFARRTGNPRAAKVLSELVIRGVAARKRRGRYRFLRPSEKPDLRLLEWNRVRSAILDGPNPKAWDGPSAVEAWTAGRYRVAPSVYSAFFNVAVPTGSIPLWEAYLSARGISLRSRKRIGPRVELREESDLHPSELSGEPVIPRERVVEFIREHPGIYAGAEELLLD